MLRYTKMLIILFVLLFVSCNKEEVNFVHLNEKDDLSLLEYKEQEPVRIVIHCTWTDPSSKWGPDRLLSLFFDSYGWSKPGYHDYITQDGTNHNLTPIDCDNYLQYSELAWGAKGYNNNSIHISLEGGAKRIGGRFIDSNNFTWEQMRSLQILINNYLSRFPSIQEVIPHRNINSNKTCPVFNISDLDINI